MFHSTLDVESLRPIFERLQAVTRNKTLYKGCKQDTHIPYVLYIYVHTHEPHICINTLASTASYNKVFYMVWQC